MSRSHILLVAVLLVSLGCGEQRNGLSPADQRKSASTEKGPPPAAPAEQAAGAEKPAERQIVYNADLQIIVPDLDQAEHRLNAAVKAHGAAVASGEVFGSSGGRRQGTWKVRVPPGQLDGFLEAVTDLGVVERVRRDSQDVTDEYYDLADRLKNKKLEQETLRGYLQEKKATSKLEEILLIEKELNRVRTEADQLEGRLRRLKDLTSLATVTISLQEIKDYRSAQTRTFGDMIGTTFESSVGALVQLGKGLVLAAAALLPWVAVLSVPAWVISRRRRRATKAKAAERPAG